MDCFGMCGLVISLLSVRCHGYSFHEVQAVISVDKHLDENLREASQVTYVYYSLEALFTA